MALLVSVLFANHFIDDGCVPARLGVIPCGFGMLSRVGERQELLLEAVASVTAVHTDTKAELAPESTPKIPAV